MAQRPSLARLTVLHRVVLLLAALLVVGLIAIRLIGWQSWYAPYAIAYVTFPLMLGGFGVYLERQRIQGWLAMGDALGFAARGGAPAWWDLNYRALEGRHAGYAVVLDAYTTGGGKSTTWWTSIELSGFESAQDMRLRVTQRAQATAADAGARPGATASGDARFDQAFRVEANDARAVQRVLGSATRAAVHRLAPFEELVIEQRRVRCLKRQRMTDAARMRETLESLAQVAGSAKRAA